MRTPTDRQIEALEGVVTGLMRMLLREPDESCTGRVTADPPAPPGNQP